VEQAQFKHALAETMGTEEFDGAVFQETGPNAVFDVIATVAFEDDCFDAGIGEEVGEDEARRAGADDANLRPGHRAPSVAMLGSG
jgi:hypothetical protein